AAAAGVGVGAAGAGVAAPAGAGAAGAVVGAVEAPPQAASSVVTAAADPKSLSASRRRSNRESMTDLLPRTSSGRSGSIFAENIRPQARPPASVYTFTSGASGSTVSSGRCDWV